MREITDRNERIQFSPITAAVGLSPKRVITHEGSLIFLSHRGRLYSAWRRGLTQRAYRVSRVLLDFGMVDADTVARWEEEEKAERLAQLAQEHAERIVEACQFFRVALGVGARRKIGKRWGIKI